jgi:hypothetical protein
MDKCPACSFPVEVDGDAPVYADGHAIAAGIPGVSFRCDGCAVFTHYACGRDGYCNPCNDASCSVCDIISFDVKPTSDTDPALICGACRAEVKAA